MKLRNAGISFIEIMISGAILAGSIYVVMISMDSQKSVKKTAESSEKVVELNNQIIHSFQKVFFDTVSSTNKKTDGVCSLVYADNSALPPVGSVYVDLKNQNKLAALMSDSRLEKYISGWKANVKDACQKNFKNCNLSIDSSKAENAPLVKLSPKLKLQLKVINMNPTKGKILEEYDITNTAKIPQYIDVKTIGFTFISDLEITVDKVVKKSHLEIFEWIGNAGYCDFNSKILSISGMEAVSGDNIIFNRAGFETNQQKPIKFVPRKTFAQAGKYTEDGRHVQTDTSQNIETSCKEIQFRCRQVDSDEREYEDLSVVVDIDYLTPNNLTNAPNISSKITYEVSKGGNRINVPMDVYFGHRVSCNNTAGAGCSKDSLSVVLDSSHQISTTIWDPNSKTRSNNACRQICNKNQNYNTASGDLTQRWNGYMNIEYPVFNQKASYSVSNSIGCTACYMKNCDQFGLGTFGPMNKMPYQPLDAQIPECIAHDTQTTQYNHYPYLLNPTSINSSGQKCIAAELNSSKDGLEFKEESCASPLPVMCFGFGKYLLARDVASNGKLSLASKKYKDAAERCFQMGKEITDKARLDSYLGGVPPLQVVGKNYEFYNITQQGMFIAPQSQDDISNFSQWVTEQGINPKTKFWVALKADGQSSLSSKLPLIPTFIDDKNDALYFDGNKVITYQNYPHKLPTPTTGAGYGMLFHNVKYKGLRLFADYKPLGSTKSKFLCRRKFYPFEFFLSSNSSDSFSDGKSYCLDDGGYFLPPTTSNEWVISMMKIDPISTKHSFPEITSITDYKEFKMAWVAVKVDDVGLDPEGINWQPVGHSEVTLLDNTDYPGYEADSSSYVVISSDGKFVDPTTKLDDPNDKNKGKKPLDLDIVCLENNNRLEVKNMGSSCDKKRINFKDVKSQSFKVLWTLYELGKHPGKYYAFEKN